MTQNEKQIDLLLRRFASEATGAPAGDHLDADEMVTVAEGKLSPAARAHYLSHLADCGQCRRQVSELTIGSGAVARLETAAEKDPGRSWWQPLTSWFSIPVLRYSSLAAVILLVAGVAFIALRGTRQNRPEILVAKNEPVSQQPSVAVNPSDGGLNSNNAPVAGKPTPMPQQPLASDQKNEQAKAAETSVPPAPVMKDAPALAEADKKAGLGEVSPKPSYAPTPPGEQEIVTRQQQSTGVSGYTVGPKKTESVDKMAETGRERDMAKEPAKPDDSNKGLMTQPATASRRPVAEKSKGGPNRGFENVQNQAVNQQRNESQAAGIGADNRKNTDEEIATRAVGGRKFRKQDGVWIDQKYKSSMKLISMSGQSEDFNKLDSGLRSIAQQLGGPAIIVWKGKAYKIQ